MKYIETLEVVFDTIRERILEEAGVAQERLEGLELSRKEFKKLYKETKLILQIGVFDDRFGQILDMGGTYPASKEGNLLGMDPTGYYATHPWPRKRGSILCVSMEVPSVRTCISYWMAGKTLCIPKPEISWYDELMNFEENRFTLLAEKYRRKAESGEISQEQAERYCRNFDYLANCDEEDFDIIFGEGCFNEIAKGYLRIAVRELVKEGKITKDQGGEIKNRFAELLESVRPKDARKA